MSNQPATSESSFMRKLLRSQRRIVILGSLAFLTALLMELSGCKLWDPDQPGGKTAKFSGFSSVPKQSEPVLDEINN